MKILLNPINGAPIKDFWIDGEFFFDSKEGKMFLPGNLLSFDDKIGEYLLGHYGFLVEMDEKEAEDYLTRKTAPLKCEKCDFATTTEISLLGHSRKHKNEKTIKDLGIPMITSTKTKLLGDVDRTQDWDKEDVLSGLEGEGLVEDAPRKSAVM